MPVGTTLEGNRIIDPKFLPLPKGPLGIPNLSSPTPLGEMEEGEIPLLLKAEPEMPPPPEMEEEMLMLPIHVTTKEVQGEQEHEK